MSDLLPALESQRTIIQRQISQLGDLRAGSVTTTGGRCGNPRCHCHEQDDPGHGPFYRLTRKIGGKTVTETFSTPAALRKAQHEVAEYHRFRELSRDLLEVNEKICQARPVEDTLTPQEKNGRSGPAGSRPRSRSTAPCCLRRSAQDRQSRSGGDRNTYTRGHAQGGCRCAEPPAETVWARPGHGPMRMRATRTVSPDAFP